MLSRSFLQRITRSSKLLSTLQQSSLSTSRNFTSTSSHFKNNQQNNGNRRGGGGQEQPKITAWVNPDNQPSGEALEKYSRDLTLDAIDGLLDPVIGREDEIRRTLLFQNQL